MRIPWFRIYRYIRRDEGLLSSLFFCVWSFEVEYITLVVRVCFVCSSSVYWSSEIIHMVISSKMLFIFLSLDGRLCALAQGWGAHLSIVSLSCLPLRAGGRASTRFPQQSGDLRGAIFYISLICLYLSTSPVCMLFPPLFLRTLPVETYVSLCLSHTKTYTHFSSLFLYLSTPRTYTFLSGYLCLCLPMYLSSHLSIHL